MLLQFIELNKQKYVKDKRQAREENKFTTDTNKYRGLHIAKHALYQRIDGKSRTCWKIKSRNKCAYASSQSVEGVRLCLSHKLMYSQQKSSQVKKKYPTNIIKS